MPVPVNAILIALLVAIATIVILEFGIRVGRRRKNLGLEPGSGSAIEGSVFAIFGLLVAFTFSGAASRFDERRAQITSEANAIGTAWLRIDLLPAAHQPALRNDLRRYVDERLATFGSFPDVEKAIQHKNAADALQGVIWKDVVRASQDNPYPGATAVVIPAFNDMFDLATVRLRAIYNHPPLPIFALLVAMALVCAFIAGNGLAQEHPNRIHSIGFALVIALVVYIILDLEYPRFGFIRIDAADQVIVDVRAAMGPITTP